MSVSITSTPRSHTCTPLIGLAYTIALCVSSNQFHRYLRKIKMPIGEHPEYLVDEDTDANVHFLKSPDKKRYAIVCISNQAGESIPKVMSLLVHEAVHIWQWHCAYMGEDDPSREFEAYSIQAISKLLMEEYVRAVQAA